MVYTLIITCLVFLDAKLYDSLFEGKRTMASFANHPSRGTRISTSVIDGDLILCVVIIACYSMLITRIIMFVSCVVVEL